MTMQRNPSDSSTSSTSRLKKSWSSLRRLGSTAGSKQQQDRAPVSPVIAEPPQVQVQKFVQELDATETAAVPPAPIQPADDPDFQELLFTVERLNEALGGSLGVDEDFLIYSKCRERMSALCRSLVERSQASNRNHGLDNISEKGTTERTMDELWFSALDSYVTYQAELLGNMRDSLEATYRDHKTDVTTKHVEALFYDRSFRDVELRFMRNPGIPITRSEPPEFWIEYAKRFGNFDRLKLDTEQTRHFLSMAMCLPNSTEVKSHDIEISTRGDVVLQFTNFLSSTHPVVRFRVSSHMLMAASPYFARILSPSNGHAQSFEDETNTPPPPRKQISKDGSTVKLYRMPQTEPNKHGALAILLHACHFNNDKVPREVTFDEFVSVAEVCLRYECTSPLESIVECRWLQQWMHKANEDSDGMLLISYVFGLRRLFTRTSKTAILHIADHDEPQHQELWPQEVKQKILAVRLAKIAQIHAACVSAVEEYFCIPLNPPIGNENHSPLEMSSVPKCPKGSHQCDAMNLGWLMLSFNELGVLPNIMAMINGRRMPSPPSRSINELVDCLRRIPSAPQVHTGVCDHISAFRSSMNDIYNSITGLTFWDICGKGGWALSRHHDTNNGLKDKSTTEIFELPASLGPITPDRMGAGDDAVTLGIMAQLDDLQDLQSAAMIDKGFYTVYKKHELFLIKTVIKAAKRKASSSARVVKFAVEDDDTSSAPVQPSQIITSEMTIDRRSLAKEAKNPSSGFPPDETFTEDLFDTSPPQSPSYSGVNKNPWIEMNTPPSEEFDESGLDPDINSKFLSGDFVHLDKALVVEGKKHLRIEQHMALGSGPRNGPASPVD